MTGPGNDSIKDSSSIKQKKSGQKKLIQSMLCCFGRPRRKFSLTKHNLQEETWTSGPTSKTETTPPPTPTPTPTNSVEENKDEVNMLFAIICLIGL